jgi:hypothetical protein
MKNQEKSLFETVSNLTPSTSMEQVEHPTHYNQGIEVWDFTTSHNMGFLDGNIVKYVTRFRHKNGLQDLLKAQQYLNKLIEVETLKEKK